MKRKSTLLIVSMTFILFSICNAAINYGPNLSLNSDAGADGSSKASGTSYGDVIDANDGTYWSPSSSAEEAISVKWNNDVTANTAIIKEPTNCVTSWKLVDHSSGDILATGSQLGSEAIITFDDYTSSKLKLLIESASSIPQITEFEVYNSTGMPVLVTSAINGSVSPLGGTYTINETVSLTATPDEGYEFRDWSGDAAGTANPLAVTMDSDKNISANFEVIATGDWMEDFNLPDGTTVDNGTTSWTRTEAPGTAANVNTQRFSSRGNGSSSETNTWTSEEINLGGGTAHLSLDVSCGADKFESSDNYTIKYKIDGGSPITIFNTDDFFSAQTVSESGITGSSLQIIVEMTNSGSDEYYYLDNVCVSGLGAPIQYSLTTTAIHGSVTPSSGSFAESTQVNISAIPDTGYVFSGWSGDATGTANPLNVTMDTDKNITAIFTAIPTYSLSTTAVNGSISPASGTFVENEVVSLTATANEGYVFSGWSSDASGSANPLSVTMDANKNITAIFNEEGSSGGESIDHNFTESGTSSTFYSISGNLSTSKGTVNYEGLTLTQCLKIETSTSISFTSTEEGALTLVFNEGWNGGIFIDGSSQEVSNGILTIPLAAGNHSLSKDNVANLYFLSLSNAIGSTIQYTLTIAAENGSISPAGGFYNENEVVSISATADQGYAFTGWGGDISGTTNPIDVTMNSDKDIVANFEAVPTYTITTSVTGEGTVDPAAGTFNEGTIVNLTATPANGYTVDTWSGVDNSNGNTATVTMDANKNVSVTFIEQQGSTSITIQEYEAGFVSVDGSVDTDNNGFTGSGYCNTNNTAGAGIDYKINVISAGTYTVGIQYAGAADRPATIKQNGTEVSSGFNMLSTGSWTSYSYMETSVNLNAGISDLRLEATGSDGLLSIDYITISGPSIVAIVPQFNLSTNIIPDPMAGNISLSPAGGVYDQGTIVTLTATPTGVYDFAGWSGGASGTSPTITLTMSSELNVSAIFTDPTDTTAMTDMFAQVGYSTLGAGTIGGLGGTEVTVSTGSELQAEINKGGPRIIYVDGIITTSNSGSLSAITIDNKSNISILGVGTSGEMDGIGILMKNGSSNIIIRNMKIHHVQTGPKDAIGIDGTGDGVSNIWVDHCELYSQYQGVGKDDYDGLFDTKRKAKNITFSWNFVHDGHKAMLQGYSDSDDAERSHTFHHNYFFNLGSRVPSVRYNSAHVFNNYYLDVNSGANSRMGACLRIEKNYYENTTNTVGSWYSDVDGNWELIDNFLVNSTGPASSGCSLTTPYDYNSVLHNSIEVKAVVLQHAGVGKLSFPEEFNIFKSTGDSSEQEQANAILQPELFAYPNPFSTELIIPVKADAEDIIVTDITGRVVSAYHIQIAEDNVKITFDANLPGGILLISLKSNNSIKTIRVLKR